MNGQAIDKIVNGNYHNFGLIIDETVVNDTVFVYSDWFKGDFLWARYILLTVGIDQSYDIYLYRKTPENITDWGSAIVSGGTTTSTTYATIVKDAVNNGLLGYEFRFGLRNSSGGAATTRAKLYAQAFSG